MSILLLWTRLNHHIFHQANQISTQRSVMRTVLLAWSDGGLMVYAPSINSVINWPSCIAHSSSKLTWNSDSIEPQYLLGYFCVCVCKEIWGSQAHWNRHFTPASAVDISLLWPRLVLALPEYGQWRSCNRLLQWCRFAFKKCKCPCSHSAVQLLYSPGGGVTKVRWLDKNTAAVDGV